MLRYILRHICIYIYFILVSLNGRVKSHNKLRVNKQLRLFNLAFLTVIYVDQWRRCGFVGVREGRGNIYICDVYPEVVGDGGR